MCLLHVGRTHPRPCPTYGLYLHHVATDGYMLSKNMLLQQLELVKVRRIVLDLDTINQLDHGHRCGMFDFNAEHRLTTNNLKLYDSAGIRQAL